MISERETEVIELNHEQRIRANEVVEQMQDEEVQEQLAYELIYLRDRILAADAKLNEPVGDIRTVRLRSGFISRLDGGTDPTYSEYVLLDDHLQAMRARLPDNYVLVPMEPTREMITSGKIAAVKTNNVCTVYAAMLAASPKPE